MVLECLHCGKIDCGFEKKEYTEVLYRGKDTGKKVRVCNECNSIALVVFAGAAQ